MGLDMYAYVGRPGQQDEYNRQDGDWDPDTKEWKTSGPVAKPRQIAYWRKHPNLHGWMEKLAEAKGLEYDSFNGIELELTWGEIDMLEQDIKNGNLAKLDTTGFFFGKPSDSYYKEQDLKFCSDAKADLFLGLQVFYNSSW
jgi:hypothetical protein